MTEKTITQKFTVDPRGARFGNETVSPLIRLLRRKNILLAKKSNCQYSKKRVVSYSHKTYTWSTHLWDIHFFSKEVL